MGLIESLGVGVSNCREDGPLIALNAAAPGHRRYLHRRRLLHRTCSKVQNASGGLANGAPWRSGDVTATLSEQG